MGVEMMSTQVYVTKNVDAAAEIQDILTKQYGNKIYDHTFSKTLRIPF
jgi:BarA-like signal transduction histidine kinase